MTTVTYCTERKTCGLQPLFGSLNMKSEVFSDFVSLESSRDVNPSSAGVKNNQVFTRLHVVIAFTHNLQVKKSRSGESSPAAQQARCWSAALMAKKAAMENLLAVQKSLEEVEDSIAVHLSKDTIKSAHARFLSTLNPSNPDGYYLLTVGRAVVCPLSVRLEGCRTSSVGASL